jgi:SPP1 family predicted phage head-tail adaptor
MTCAPTHALTETITVESSTSENDTSGSPVKTWATFLSNIKANVQQVGGSENATYGADRQTSIYTVTISYRADINNTMRIKWTPLGGSELTLEVESVNNASGRNVLTQISARQIGGINGS